MGWNRGSNLFRSVAPVLMKLKRQDRKAVYDALVDFADEQDWDTQYEVFGLDPVLDEVLKENGHGCEEDDEMP